MSSIKCTVLREDATIIFAKEELLKYAAKVQQPITYSFILGLTTDFTQEEIIDNPIFDDSIDSYQLQVMENEINIIGSNPRSVLFGVYQVCKKLFGYKWVNFLSNEKIDYYPYEVVTTHYRGKMKRRGLVVENYDNPAFLLQLIDWAAKHNVNELFFTFMLWDKVKHVVAPEIEKRGISITLGGHSMHYLLKDRTGTEKTQIDFSEDSWKDLIIEKVKNYCEETSSITRLSLWPADIGIEEDKPFLPQYIAFTEQIQSAIPMIEVEHIAYNAGLSWNMLEQTNDVDNSNIVNTLFAYWGRNYQQAFTEEERAFKALQKWSDSTKQKQKELTVFEYYSDHFMLGDLFPPLFKRIREDIELFEQLGIENIVNLIVPYLPKETTLDIDQLYPWESIQLMNAYYWARLSWGDRFEEIDADFYSMFGNAQTEVKHTLGKIETLLSEISKWNVPLFPSRLIDPEKVENLDDIKSIIAQIKKWKNDIEELSPKRTEEIIDPYSMVLFYIYYLDEKLANYLDKYMSKV